MPDDVNVATIKQSERLILEVLGLQKSSNHAPCPFCRDSSGLSVYFLAAGNHWRYKCHKCGVGGSVFDALAKLSSLSFSEAKTRCMEMLGLKSPQNGKQRFTSSNGVRQQSVEEVVKSSPKQEPELDFRKAEDFIKKCHNVLMNSDDLVERYMQRKRGISEAIAKRYRLGFIQHGRYPSRRKDKDGGAYGDSMMLPASWVLPLTDHEGNLKAVKLHHEIMPTLSDGSKAKGKSRPVSGICKTDVFDYNAFWPHPATQEKKISGINFTRDANWWLSRLPDGQIKDQFKKGLYNYSTFLNKEVGGKHPDDFGPKEHEIVFQYTFEQMQEKIKQEVLRVEKKEDDPDRSIHNWVIITPGELKALAYISAGFIATSGTGGESNVPHRDYFQCFRGRRVALNWDDDAPSESAGKVQCTGPEWVRKMTDLLEDAKALEIRAFTWGRKERD